MPQLGVYPYIDESERRFLACRPVLAIRFVDPVHTSAFTSGAAMKLLRNLLGSQRQHATGDAVPKSAEEYSWDSSFSWFGNGPADSSIFDSGSAEIEQSGIGDTVSLKALEADALCDTEEDTGFDPYNTGRFDTSKID